MQWGWPDSWKEDWALSALWWSDRPPPVSYGYAALPRRCGGGGGIHFYLCFQGCWSSIYPVNKRGWGNKFIPWREVVMEGSWHPREGARSMTRQGCSYICYPWSFSFQCRSRRQTFETRLEGLFWLGWGKVPTPFPTPGYGITQEGESWRGTSIHSSLIPGCGCSLISFSKILLSSLLHINKPKETLPLWVAVIRVV